MVISISDVLSLIGTVVDVYTQVKSNKRQVGFLIEKIQKIEPYICELQEKSGVDLSDEINRELKEFYDLLSEIQRFVTKFTDLSYMMKVWKRNKHSETFVGFNIKLEDFITRMQFGIVSRIADQQVEIFQSIELDKIELHEMIANHHDLMEANHLEVLEVLQMQIKEIKLVNKEISDTNASKKARIFESQGNDITSMLNDLFNQMMMPQPSVLHPSLDEKETEKLKILVNSANDEPNSEVQQASHNLILPALKTVAVFDVTFSRDCLSRLGEGGFGEVYLGQHAGASVAVKVLRGSTPVMLKALKKEAMIMQLISNNPGIVAFYGVQIDEAPYYIVMEYCMLSLHDLLYPDERNNVEITKIPDNLTPFTEERKTTLLYQVCCAMQYMHTLKIAHRDLKPANVLISAEGQAKLSDFGLAQIKHIVFTSSTAAVAPKGTAYYMAPELLLSEDNSPVYNESSDMYAFAIVMNETLAGRKPFEGLNMQPFQLQRRFDKNIDFRPDLFRKDEDFKRTGDGIVFTLQKLIIKSWHSNPFERYAFKALANELKVFALHSFNYSSPSIFPIPSIPSIPPIPTVIIDKKMTADNVKEIENLNNLDCEEIFVKLDSFRNDHTIVKIFLKRISELCGGGKRPDNVNTKSFTQAAKGCELLVQLLYYYSKECEISAYVLMTIMAVARLNSNAQKVIKCGGCEAVMLVLKTHIINESIAEKSCWAIVNLAYNDENAVKIGTLGGCEAVVSALNIHVGNAAVAEWGCMAICNLARDNANAGKIGTLGGCEIVVSAINTHLTNEAVAENGCMAIVNLANNDSNKAKLGSCGGCEAVVAALNNHVENAAVGEKGCIAINTLAYNNHVNIVKFGSCGGCQALVSVLKTHVENAAVVQEGCWSIKILTHNNQNTVKFVTCGAREAVVSVLNNHVSNKDVKKQGQDVLYKLKP